MDNITKLEFFKNAYTAVIDFRTTAQWDIAASGLQLESSQAGIVLRIRTTRLCKNLVLDQATTMTCSCST